LNQYSTFKSKYTNDLIKYLLKFPKDIKEKVTDQNDDKLLTTRLLFAKILKLLFYIFLIQSRYVCNQTKSILFSIH